jgi:aryl-alcohol dehydrogenase-like predicted oxidoreductase
MTLSGYATPAGTRRYRQRFEGKTEAALFIAPGHFRETAAQGGAEPLHVTSLGMGTYLGETDPDTSALMTEAAVRSVASGAINVLDTAINYRYQLSERAVGRAIRELTAMHGIQRDEVMICTKNGFLSPDAERQPRNEDFRAWFRARYLDSGLIQPDDIAGGMHCMAPGYLRDQIGLSRENLGLETIDLLYLHNAAESQLPAVGRDVFQVRLARAFETLEEARAAGEIRAYGLATWSCFRVEPDQPQEYLNLETVLQLAETVGGENHGFRFVQLPFNLAFPEAVTLEAQTVQGEPMSLLEAAMALGIGVFTSVPLLQGQLLKERLPHFEGLETPAQGCLQFARSHPGVLAPLAGHKQPEHVADNLQVASVPPLRLPEFEKVLSPL